MPIERKSPDARLVRFNTSIAGTATSIDFDYYGHAIAAAGLNGPWYPSLINFHPISAKAQRALLLERIMDAELPRYAEALKRLGEWTT